MADRTRLDGLRARIRSLEQGDAAERPALPLGVPEIDGALPGGGLAIGRVHQITGGEDGFAGPAVGFTAILAARLSDRAGSGGGVLWIVQGGSADDTLYPPGLAGFGLPPERLAVARARDEAEVLWTMEEALRSPALAVVVAQARKVDLTAGRRLQLAAEQSGTTGFLLPSLHGAGWRPPGKVPAAAASTRWLVEAAPAPSSVAPAPSSVAPAPSSVAPAKAGAQPVPPDQTGLPPARERREVEAGAPPERREAEDERTGVLGPARWKVTLERCQGGVPRGWLVEWNDETGRLAVVSALPDRSADAAGSSARRLA